MGTVTKRKAYGGKLLRQPVGFRQRTARSRVQILNEVALQNKKAVIASRLTYENGLPNPKGIIA